MSDPHIDRNACTKSNAIRDKLDDCPPGIDAGHIQRQVKLTSGMDVSRSLIRRIQIQEYSALSATERKTP